MTQVVRVGVVGVGVIAQVMHLHYLRELRDHFDVVALCDVTAGPAQVSADTYGIGRVLTDWRELLREPIDAVLVLTSGSHAPIAIEAARLGKHVLLEKPMCFSLTEGRQVRESARQAGTVVMVAYPKRYDPAFAVFRRQMADVVSPRMLRVTTFEALFQPYIQHYGLPPAGPVSAAQAFQWQQQRDATVVEAIGGVEQSLGHTYTSLLLDTLVHELNTIRALLGEPDRLDYVDLREGSLTVCLTFADLPVVIHWLDVPGPTAYGMEFAYFGANSRLTLNFPSPFLRNAPATIGAVSGMVGEPGFTRSESVVSYESGFKRELLAFHECVVTHAEPQTDAADSMHDLALCKSIVECVQSGKAVDRPSAFGVRTVVPVFTERRIAVASAPINYGAFELTVGIDPNVPSAIAVLDEVSGAGYDGIDLGPVGYLGSVRELPARFAARNLGLAGGYIEFPFADPAGVEATLPELDALLDCFDSVPAGTRPRARPTIADSGSESRRSRPGSGALDPESGHSAQMWALFGAGLNLVVDRCRVRGYEPTFHNETGSYVESPCEIETVLGLSDVGLCLDTGHLMVGGGDPVEAVLTWRSRINQVHIKDADLSIFRRVVESGERPQPSGLARSFPRWGGAI